MVITKPPEPITSFGNEYFFKRPFYLFRFVRFVYNGIFHQVTCFFQKSPALVVFGMTDPNVEIMIDPGAWKEFRQRPWWKFFQIVSNRGRLNDRIIGKLPVETPQEVSSVSGIVFPGVLTVQDHRHQCRRAGGTF